MGKKYTHIFFDLDKTLWDFEKNSRAAMQATFNAFNLAASEIKFDIFFDIYSKHNHELWGEYRNKEVGKKQLIRERFQNTFLDLKIEGIVPEQMNTFYLDEMSRQNLLCPGAIETLQYLRSKRYLLFIITNGFKEVQLRKLESSGLKIFFNKVFTSEEIKTPKPGREIFEYAIKSANAKKNKSLMIGDDWEVDIMGAANFGLDAIHITNTAGPYVEALKDITNKNSIIGVERLLDIKELL